jgi:hypothetical protein
MTTIGHPERQAMIKEENEILEARLHAEFFADLQKNLQEIRLCFSNVTNEDWEMLNKILAGSGYTVF